MLDQLAELLATDAAEVHRALEANGGRISGLAPRLARAVQSYKIKSTPRGDDVVEVKLVDRLRAIDLAGRHMTVNAFGDRNRAEAAGSFAELLRALSGAVSQGKTIDAELVHRLVGENAG